MKALQKGGMLHYSLVSSHLQGQQAEFLAATLAVSKFGGRAGSLNSQPWSNEDPEVTNRLSSLLPKDPSR
eukprot:415366-Amphidinium_carterae.1